MKTKHYARVGRIFEDLKNYPLGSSNRKHLFSNNKQDTSLSADLLSNTTNIRA